MNAKMQIIGKNAKKMKRYVNAEGGTSANQGVMSGATGTNVETVNMSKNVKSKEGYVKKEDGGANEHLGEGVMTGATGTIVETVHTGNNAMQKIRYVKEEVGVKNRGKGVVAGAI